MNNVANDFEDTETPLVVLLHGLGESSSSMRAIEACLTWSGYDVVNLDYPYRTMDIGQLVDIWMPKALEPFRAKKTVHFVTHSLGGILVRGFLERKVMENLGRVVMLAPPNQGSPIFNLYRKNPLFIGLLGPPSEQCGTDHKSFMRSLKERVEFPLGVIAGCIPYDPISWFVMAPPHDGRLPVGNTMVDGMADHITVPSGHEFIIANPLAVNAVREFLGTGTFGKAGRSADQRQ